MPTKRRDVMDDDKVDGDDGDDNVENDKHIETIISRNLES